MKKLIAILFAVMTAVCLMIPVFASAENDTYPRTMWVNCANGKTLNLRAEPSTRARRLTSLECGTRVDVLYQADVSGWVYVVPRGFRDGGFVMTKFLVAKQPGKYEITEREDNFRAVTPYNVTLKPLNDRSDRSVGLRVSPNKWNKVMDPLTGRTGFVANEYLIRL